MVSVPLFPCDELDRLDQRKADIIARDAVLVPPQFRDSAFEDNKTSSIHRWVPWIAGFSAAFVADMFHHYLPTASDPSTITILEPFSGVGTTLVEGLLHGYNVIGFEVNPYAALASRVKCTAYLINPTALQTIIDAFERTTQERTAPLDAAFACQRDPFTCSPLPQATPPPQFRSRVPFFSPFVLQKVLHCLDGMRAVENPAIRDLMLLAFGSVMVRFSNYTYEPSLGSRAGAQKPNILNADVVGILVQKLRHMHTDLLAYREAMQHFRPSPLAQIFPHNALDLSADIPPQCADLVVTSPPYLNNYHYIRNTRPQMFWLDFVAAPAELKAIERANFGKFWQTVRDGPHLTLDFELPELQNCIDQIAIQNPEKGVYSGAGWANYATAYFNDSRRICCALRYALKPAGVAVFVLGNSITQGVEIPTDRFFGQIAEKEGLILEDIHLLRTKRVGNSIVQSSVRNGQRSTATLYETAVVLRQPSVG